MSDDAQRTTPIGMVVVIVTALLGAALFGGVIWLTCFAMSNRAAGPILAWSVFGLAVLAGVIYGAKWGERFVRWSAQRSSPVAAPSPAVDTHSDADARAHLSRIAREWDALTQRLDEAATEALGDEAAELRTTVRAAREAVQRVTHPPV